MNDRTSHPTLASAEQVSTLIVQWLAGGTDDERKLTHTCRMDEGPLPVENLPRAWRGPAFSSR